MINNRRLQRGVFRCAFILTIVGTVHGQLHALARIAAHPQDLEYPLTRWWAVPAGRALRPLFDWSDPYTVYVAYGRGWLPIFLSGVLCGIVAINLRQPRGVERIAWWLMVASLGLLTLAVVGDYFTPWMDQFFVATVVNAFLLMISTTAVGVILIRTGFRPRGVGWLMVAVLPLAWLIVQITSLGNAFLPILWAIVLATRSMLREPTQVGITPPVPAGQPSVASGAPRP